MKNGHNKEWWDQMLITKFHYILVKLRLDKDMSWFTVRRKHV
jgi:expansin (peptidoglycan-binding protein)